jgi:hypothetical protein
MLTTLPAAPPAKVSHATAHRSAELRGNPLDSPQNAKPNVSEIVAWRTRETSRRDRSAGMDRDHSLGNDSTGQVTECYALASAASTDLSKIRATTSFPS